MPEDLKELVKHARDSDADFEALLSNFIPGLRVIAYHLDGGRWVDDLVQEARIGIWRSLDKIDLRRPGTIRQVVVRIGINKMKDEVKRRIRRAKKGVISCDDVNEVELAITPNGRGLFGGLLAEYETFIRMNGKFKGAHEHMASKYGISLWSMRRKFHKAVKRWLEGNKQ